MKMSIASQICFYGRFPLILLNRIWYQYVHRTIYDIIFQQPKRSSVFWGIQRWDWLCSWSCVGSFQTFCLHLPGGTLPLSIRLLSPFSSTRPRCIRSPSKTLMAMAMATWQVWETLDRSEESRGVGLSRWHLRPQLSIGVLSHSWSRRPVDHSHLCLTHGRLWLRHLRL